MKYVALTATILLICAAAALMYWAAEEGGQRPAPTTTGGPPGSPTASAPRESETVASLEARGVEVGRRDKTGKLLWRLKAGGKLQADKARGEVFTQDVSWVLETPDKVWTAHAQRAYVNEPAQEVGLAGAVRLATQDSTMAFEAESVTYRMGSRKLILKGPVKVRINQAVVTASRVVVDLDAKTVRAHQVKARCKL